MKEDVRGDRWIDVEQELLGHRDQHPVGQHRPLRMTGRPRCVKDPGQVLGLDGRTGGGGPLALQQWFVAEILPFPGAGEDEVLDRLKAIPHPVHVGPELAAGDQRERAGVVQHVGVLVGMEPDVHRDGGHPRLDRTEDPLEPFGAVGHEQAHPVARLPTQGQ